MMKKILITIFSLIITLFFGLYFSCQNFNFIWAATDIDTVPVNLHVNGCNNNGVCEAIIGEDILSCPGDCTPPPPPPPSGGGGKIIIFPPKELDITPPQNPLNVKAVGIPEGILLTWQNPPDLDFSYIRIMRNDKQFYGDPFIGKLIYEGKKGYFLDKNVIEGKEYFYTFFSRDTTGNFSGGSAASATAYSKDKKPISEKPKEEIKIFEIPKYLVHQYNKQVKPFSFEIPAEVNNIENIIIDTETLVFSNDFLTVTNSKKENLGQYMFSFNKNSGRYESIIPPLPDEGIYLIEIYRQKENIPQILTKGFLSVKSTEKIIVSEKNICKIFDYDIVLYIGYFLLLVLLIMILKFTTKNSEKA